MGKHVFRPRYISERDLKGPLSDNKTFLHRMIIALFLVTQFIASCYADRLSWVELHGYPSPLTVDTLQSAVFCWKYWPKTQKSQLKKHRLQFRRVGDDKFVSVDGATFISPPTLSRYGNKYRQVNWRGRNKCTEVLFRLPPSMDDGLYAMSIKYKNSPWWFDRSYGEPMPVHVSRPVEQNVFNTENIRVEKEKSDTDKQKFKFKLKLRKDDEHDSGEEDAENDEDFGEENVDNAETTNPDDGLNQYTGQMEEETDQSDASSSDFGDDASEGVGDADQTGEIDSGAVDNQHLQTDAVQTGQEAGDMYNFGRINSVSGLDDDTNQSGPSDPYGYEYGASPSHGFQDDYHQTGDNIDYSTDFGFGMFG